MRVPFNVSSSERVRGLGVARRGNRGSTIIVNVPKSNGDMFLRTLVYGTTVGCSPSRLGVCLVSFSKMRFGSSTFRGLPRTHMVTPRTRQRFNLDVLGRLIRRNTEQVRLYHGRSMDGVISLGTGGPSLRVPHLLIVVSRFRGVFRVRGSLVDESTGTGVRAVVRRFHGFKVGLMLTARGLPSASVLPGSLVTGHIMFGDSPTSFSTLVSLPAAAGAPRLRANRYVCGSRSKSPCSGRETRNFLIAGASVSGVLGDVSSFTSSRRCSDGRNVIIFHNGRLPRFREHEVSRKRRVPLRVPRRIKVCFKRSVSVGRASIYTALQGRSTGGVLMLKNRPRITREVTCCSAVSTAATRTSRSTAFIGLGFVHESSNLDRRVRSIFSSLPFPSRVVSGVTSIARSLSTVGRRVRREEGSRRHPRGRVCLSVCTFRLTHVFSGKNHEKSSMSRYNLLLSCVLGGNPAINIFAVLRYSG